MRTCLVILLLVFFPLMPAYAGEADMVAVEVHKTGDNAYAFHVTVAHKDEGWNHCVNKWDVMGPHGTVHATRILYHPHVDEHPFARSLSGVKLPEEIRSVTIRAHDSVHEYGGKVVTVELPR